MIADMKKRRDEFQAKAKALSILKGMRSKKEHA